MIAIWTMCAWIAWTPASGDPAGHYFYEDALPAIVALTPEMEVCRVNWDTPHVYSVAGFTADGVGPESDDLTVIWPSGPSPTPTPTATPTPTPTATPVPEPEAWMTLLAGWIAIHGLLHWRNWRRRRNDGSE